MPTTKMKHETLVAIADKVVAVFAVGNDDPHASDIHAALDADEDSPDVSPGVVLASLPDVKAKLEDDPYRLAVCLVADPYYEKYDKSPETTAQARDCLPMGNGKQSVGIKKWKEGDLVAEAWLEELLRRAAGMLSANTTRGIRALDDGRMEQEKLVRMLQEAMRRAGEIERGEKRLPKGIQRELLNG